MPQVNEFSWFYSYVMLYIFFIGFLLSVNCLISSMVSLESNFKKFTFNLNLN